MSRLRLGAGLLLSAAATFTAAVSDAGADHRRRVYALGVGELRAVLAVADSVRTESAAGEGNA